MEAARLGEIEITLTPFLPAFGLVSLQAFAFRFFFYAGFFSLRSSFF
jgi:hypothetical protein